MDSSSTSVATVPDPASTSLSGSGASNPTSTPQAQETQALAAEEKLQNQFGKLNLANHARGILDNQRILDMTAAEDQQVRQQRMQFRQERMSKFTGESAVPATAQAMVAPLSEVGLPESSMGTISIDSPVTTHHHYPAAPMQPLPPPYVPPVAPVTPAPVAPPAPATPSLWSKLWPYLVAAGLAAGGGTTGYLLKPSAPASSSTNTTNGFLIDLPDGKAPAK